MFFFVSLARRFYILSQYKFLCIHIYVRNSAEVLVIPLVQRKIYVQQCSMDLIKEALGRPLTQVPLQARLSTYERVYFEDYINTKGHILQNRHARTYEHIKGRFFVGNSIANSLHPSSKAVILCFSNKHSPQYDFFYTKLFIDKYFVC